MKVVLGKLFIAFNLYVVALSGFALEVNLSPVSLFGGEFGHHTHGNVLFEVDGGRIKFGPTMGVNFNSSNDVTNYVIYVV